MVAATTTTSCRFVYRFGSLVRCCMLLTMVVAMVKRLFAIVCFVFVVLCVVLFVLTDTVCGRRVRSSGGTGVVSVNDVP